MATHPDPISSSIRKPVLCLGEAIIDFVAAEPGPLADVVLFEKSAGGSPANVAVGLARLGIPSAFIGKLGDDAFGHYLANVLSREGVDVSSVTFCRAHGTCHTFVSLTELGDREFLFSVERSADTFLSVEDLNVQQILGAAALHAGTFSLRHEPARSATLAAVLIANHARVPVSFDPNLRISLWPSDAALRKQALRLWRCANVIKATEEELLFLANRTERRDAVNSLWHDQLRLLAVTLGSRGAEVYTPDGSVHVPSFPVTPIDTTGAGDGFVAGLLSRLVSKTRVSLQDAAEACRRANMVGALATTKRGAINAMPWLADLPASAGL
jgi:fructokinase